MEIILAIFLFFGGFTLGSITADKDDDVQSAVALPNTDGEPGSHPVTQITRHSDPTWCHSERTVHYRDLTVPNRGQINQRASGVSDSEGDGQDE